CDVRFVLFGGGFLGSLARGGVCRRPGPDPPPPLCAPAPFVPLAPATTAAVTTAAVPLGLWPLFLFFLKVGSVLFGSGYVLLAFLQADLVDRWRLLAGRQLLDAIAPT